MYFAVVGRKLGDKWLTLMNYTSNTESQRRSIRGLSAEHKLKRSTTVHCDSILRKDLKKFPCELQIKQNINVANNKNHFLQFDNGPNRKETSIC